MTAASVGGMTAKSRSGRPAPHLYADLRSWAFECPQTQDEPSWTLVIPLAKEGAAAPLMATARTEATDVGGLGPCLARMERGQPCDSGNCDQLGWIDRSAAGAAPRTSDSMRVNHPRRRLTLACHALTARAEAVVLGA